jgi:hypothetical protein
MTINHKPPHRRILIVIVSLQQEQSRGILHDNVITTLPDMTHGTSITDVMHIPDPKHGTIIRANHNTSYTSVLRVCVAPAKSQKSSKMAQEQNQHAFPHWGGHLRLPIFEGRFWAPQTRLASGTKVRHNLQGFTAFTDTLKTSTGSVF